MIYISLDFGTFNCNYFRQVSNGAKEPDVNNILQLILCYNLSNASAGFKQYKAN